MRRILIAGVLLVAAAGVIVFLAVAPGAGGSGQADARPMPVETGRAVMLSHYDIDARYAGRITSRRTSDLGFERGGLLASVAVDEGAVVEAGEVLASLDTRALEAQLAQARAAEAEASARLQLANVTVNRQRQLLERQNVSQQRYDEARFERQAVAAQLEGARASVRALETALDLAAIEAPYDGHVVARLADEGTVINPGQAILRLRERGRLEAHIGVPPDALGGMTAGDTYQVEVRGELYPSVLSELVAEVDVETRTVMGIFLVEAPEDRVRAGELARLQLTRRVADPGFWVPIAALTEGRRGLWSLYVPVPRERDGDDGAQDDTAADDPGLAVLERRTVQLLHTEGDRAYVRGTLEDGEVYVSGGTHRLVPGQLVRVADAAPLTN